MNDLELLERYEPVLRFAKSERFFPMDVEHYLERCQLFPSGPEGVLESVMHLGDTLAKRIGKLESEQYFLRFVNDPLGDSDVWVWWAVLSVIGASAGWFFSGVAGLEVGLALAVIAALLIFMQASPIRIRIIPAALAATLFVGLEALPIWFFLHPSRYISVALEYLVLLPIYVLLLGYLSIRTMKFIFDRVIPEAPGLMMDMLSQATERIAREAYYEYARILEKDPCPIYYGRVLREESADGERWTVLQYHFFYAFNDWRLAANGMNHHEGDWEMVAIYLRHDEPHAMLFSQHGAGNIEKWDSLHKAIDKEGNTTTHPIVYVALGSHANYSRPEVIRSPNLYQAGLLQRFIYWVDGLIHYIFLLINPSQKARQIALKELYSRPAGFLAENALVYLRDEADHYVVSLPLEIASGDGFRIGFQGDNLKERVMKSSSYLKRVMSNRPVTRPTVREWRRVLLDPEPEWLHYKGLWGVKSLIQDESGPPGPKWDRPRKNRAPISRMRWSRPLDWLAHLERTLH